MSVISLRNASVLPLVVLIRAPLLMLAYALIWAGERLEKLGGSVPGLKR